MTKLRSVVSLTCTKCAKVFSRYLGVRNRELRRGTKNTYCSRKCNGSNTQRPPAHKRGHMIYLECEGCHVPFRTSFRQLNQTISRGSRHVFCSRQCSAKGKIGEKSYHYRQLGYTHVNSEGYLKVKVSDENGGTWKTEHVLKAEKVLGRGLKPGEVVHHLNGKKSDNRNCNLLICDKGYHRFLHERMGKLYQQEHFR